jgi:hypothetical protein
VTDVPHGVRREPSRHDWRAAARPWGPPGNERLTTSASLVLLVLLAVSFVVWGVVMIVHVLAYIARTLRVGPADWLPHAEQVVAGARSRRAALGGALLAGAIVALAT